MSQIMINGQLYFVPEEVVEHIEDLRNRLDIANESSEKALKIMESLKK